MGTEDPIAMLSAGHEANAKESNEKFSNPIHDASRKISRGSYGPEEVGRGGIMVDDDAKGRPRTMLFPRTFQYVSLLFSFFVSSSL